MSDNSPELAFAFINMVKEGLKTKNRFTVDKRMDTLIDYYATNDFYIETLDVSKKLYRARIYSKKDAAEKYKKQVEGQFNGYNAEGSFVNQDNKSVTEGRCNPNYIPYLYTATSENICVYEVRPALNTYISVATIQITKPLKILHFRKGIATNSEKRKRNIIKGVPNATLSLYLAEEFSRPNKGFGDYLFCQYVSERIKAFGFDGIAYTSAVCPICNDDCNVVIFNYEKCEPVSSKLYKINSIEYCYS